MQYVRTAHGLRVHFLDEQRARTYCGQSAPLTVADRPDAGTICLHCDRYRSVRGGVRECTAPCPYQRGGQPVSDFLELV